MRLNRLEIATWAGRGALLLLILALSVGTARAAELTDYNIVNAVEDELLFDAAVPFNTIDVSCAEGIVTLTGTTRDLLGKERATTLAESVKGVRGVVNRIEVDRLYSPSAAHLRESVVNALAADPATDSWEIEVEATADGQVDLSGTVDSWAERELCLNVVRGVSGVTGVRNEIRIEYDSDRPDHEIRPEIAQTLRWDALVDHGLIETRVVNGNVTLSGAVGSAAEKKRAIRDAWVPGVHTVDAEDLSVERWARDDALREDKYVLKSDGEIQQAVRDALLYDPRVYSFDVDTRVESGLVMLHGVVDNARARQAAADTARGVVGVVDVRNYVKVRPVEQVADNRLIDRVDEAIDRDAWLDDDAIAVAVDDGEVYLTGTVDWRFERNRAFDVVMTTKGVTEVHNHLDVRERVSDWTDPSLKWMWGVPYGESSTPQTNDRAIRQSIENQIWWSPFVDSEDVTVDVKNGVATLTGSVDTWREYRAAAENAFEGGAYDIRNELELTVLR